MLALERRKRILAQVATSGGARVAELARLLRVHEETIRRDLEQLDDEGKVERTHGGALLAAGTEEAPFAARATENLAAKRAIARAAARHVAEGDLIALDASSTARELAEALLDRPLTVLTCSLAVVAALQKKAKIRTIVTGGAVDAGTLSLVGPLAERAFASLPVKKLFVSCAGVDLARGLSLVTHEQSRLKRKMIESADEVYLMADASKLDRRSVEAFAPLDAIDVLITDANADAGVVRRLRKLGVRVELARR